MSRQATVGTAPELALRSALHRRGLRYRVNVPPLAGLRRRADILFPGPRVAVMVDGCFWHSCPEHQTHPRANGSWWAEKLAANVRRDRETDERLTTAGWLVIRVWEHEAVDEAAGRIAAAVRARAHP